MNTTSLQIPPQFGNLMGMGAPQGVYKAKTFIVLNLIFGGLFFLGSGAALVYALYLGWIGWGRLALPALLQSLLPWGIGAAVAFLFGLLFVWSVYNRRKKAVVVYENGLAYADRKGVQTWKWEEIQEVYANVVRNYTNGIYTGTTHTYTLVKAQGTKLVINDVFKEVEAIYNQVQSHSLQIRYQRLAAAYNGGNPVAFGPVTISKTHGITIGKKQYAWEEIAEVGINKGMLSIKKKDGGWFSGATATAGAVPNLHVLLSILDQVAGLKAG